MMSGFAPREPASRASASTCARPRSDNGRMGLTSGPTASPWWTRYSTEWLSVELERLELREYGLRLLEAADLHALKRSVEALDIAHGPVELGLRVLEVLPDHVEVILKFVEPRAQLSED